MYSMARFAGAVDPEDGSFPRSTLAFSTDAVAISIGSLFGCSPVTTFVESGAGIAEGGRTGLTAMTTGLLFFVSLFFGPIFSNIPPWATGCALVLVSNLPCSCQKILQLIMPPDRLSYASIHGRCKLGLPRRRTARRGHSPLHPLQLLCGIRPHRV